MKFGTKIFILTISMLMTFVNVQTAPAVYGSLDLLTLMKKSRKEGRDIILDIFTKKGALIGLAGFDEDDGVWYFNFPDRKTHYVAKWKEGSVDIVSPFMSNTETVVAGSTALLAIIGGGIALASFSSSSKSSGALDVPDCFDINGLYSITGPKTNDTCASTTETFSGSSLVQCQSGIITIQSRAILRGSYNDSGAVSASGTDNMAQPLVFERDTGGSILLKAFRESFNGIARQEPDGHISLSGALVFEYSIQSGRDVVCQTQFDVVFTKE